MTGNYVGTPVRTRLGFQFPVLEATVAKVANGTAKIESVGRSPRIYGLFELRRSSRL